MKLDSSTLFVNTGRKPLPAMQKKKKNNKNTVALVVCIAIIAVLCVFVGLIVHVWFNYNEEVAPKADTKVTTAIKEKNVKPKEEKPQNKTPKKEEEKPKEETKSSNTTKGEKTAVSTAATNAFKSVGGTYSFGIYSLNDDYTYIDNTEKIENSAAMGAFLLDYVSNAIYLGTFDYSTEVAGTYGRNLMTRAFSNGDLEAAILLIQHFGSYKLNAYMQSKGYENTHFGDGTSYTTAEDVIKLMKKMNDNTTFFPYSDMYSKMRASTVTDKITASLPAGTSYANIGFETDGEIFDAAIVYTNSGNFIFVSMAEGNAGNLSSAKTAMSKAAADICDALES